MADIKAINLNLDSQTNLRPAIHAWEQFLRDQGRSPNTIKSFLGDISLLVAFLPPDKMISDISIDDLNSFLEWLKNGRGSKIPCSPKSFSRRITTIKSFFRWLSSRSIIPYDPAKKVLQSSVISPLPEVLLTDEINLILSAAESFMEKQKEDYRPYCLIKLVLETGIKKSECIALKLNHLEARTSQPFIFIRYPSLLDRNKERKINISLRLLKVLESYIQQYSIHDQIFAWSPRRLEYILEDIGNTVLISKHVSFSMLRWTCALEDLKNGIEPDQIRQKLGVSKIQWRELKMKLDQLLSQR